MMPNRHNKGIPFVYPLVRIEEARLYYQIITGVRVDKKKWCKLLHIPYTNYTTVIQGKRALPNSIWVSLHLMSFSLEWFITGEGKPFKGDVSSLVCTSDVCTMPQSDMMGTLVLFKRMFI